MKTFKVNNQNKSDVLQEIYEIDLKSDHILTIKQHRETRSDAQNRYLWGFIYPIIGMEIGETVESIHEMCKAKFLSHTETIAGEQYLITRSTTKLTTEEFMQYLETIKLWAWHELQITIPDTISDEMVDEIKNKYAQTLFFLSV